jgi:hypothetical protein
VPNSDIHDQFRELLRTQLGTDVTFKVLKGRPLAQLYK